MIKGCFRMLSNICIVGAAASKEFGPCRDTFSVVLMCSLNANVIDSNVPWLDCPAANAIAWVITISK